MPKTGSGIGRGNHLHSQNNLRKWTKKTGSNPPPVAGRAKNAGASQKAWVTMLNGAGYRKRASVKELQAIIADQREEPMKRAAAISLLKSSGYDVGITMPADQLEHSRHILDYCDGKPKQTLQGPDGGPVVGGVVIMPPEEPPAE